jgi:hypothetical protein
MKNLKKLISQKLRVDWSFLEAGDSKMAGETVKAGQ